MSRAQQCDTHSHCCLGPGCVTGNKLPKTEAQTRVGDNCLRPQPARMRPVCRARQATQTLVLAEPTGGTTWPGTVAPPPGTQEAAPHHLPQGEQHTESSPFLENDRTYWSSDIRTLPLEKANVRVKRANVKAGSWPLRPHSAPRPPHERGLLLRGSQCAHKRKEL